MRDGQAGLGHPPWGVAGLSVSARRSGGGFKRDLNALSIRLPEHPCQNHDNIRVRRVLDHTATRASMPKP